MDATSTAILNTGYGVVATIWPSLLSFAATHWIPLSLAIIVVLGFIGFLYAKVNGLFGHK